MAILYGFGRYFLMDKSTDHLYHLPENATLALRIDGGTMAKSALFQILLESKDEEVLAKIEEQIEKRKKYKGPNLSLGVDYLADVLVYSFPYKSEQILGITYCLKPGAKMEENAPNILKDNQVFAVNNGVGVVLTYPKRLQSDQKVIATLQQQANAIANQAISSDLTQDLVKKEIGQLVHLSSRGNPFGAETLFNGANAKVTTEGNALNLSGNMMPNPAMKQSFKQPEFQLPVDGFHFSSALIPASFNDSLRKFLPDSVEFGKIESVSLNYRGTEIQNTVKQNLVYSPDVDLLISFSEPFDFEAFLASDYFTEHSKLTYANGTLSNDFIAYKIQQLDDRQYFVTSSKTGLSVKKGWDGHFFNLSGDAKMLTELRGNKMILSFISFVPMYSSSRDVFRRLDQLEISIDRGANDLAQLTGTMDFKDGFYPMNEFLKFVLINDLIRVTP